MHYNEGSRVHTSSSNLGRFLFDLFPGYDPVFEFFPVTASCCSSIWVALFPLESKSSSPTSEGSENARLGNSLDIVLWNPSLKTTLME